VRPWLEVCRGAAADIRQVLDDLPGRAEREPVLATGVGGDETTAIDAAAENAVVARLEELYRQGKEFLLVSEELGERGFGDSETCVVVDPIDGSINAKRGLPHFCLSVAVADGPTYADVVFAYLYDFGSGEEWTAERGRGAYLDGGRLDGARQDDEVEILVLEGTLAASVAEKADALAGFAKRFRIMGSLALALCQLAAGRVDAVCSLRAARAVDVAAAQLLVRECGLAIGFADESPWELGPLDTTPRSAVVAAPTKELRARLAEILLM
jgi:myo-inositol-1(or 4)-monophosphatase